MNKPTEKQIEAAAQAIWDRLGSEFTWAEAKALNDGQAEWAIEDARAALTAALAIEAGTEVASTHDERIALAQALSWDLCEISPDDVRGIIGRLRDLGYALTTSPASSGVEGEAVAWQWRSSGGAWLPCEDEHDAKRKIAIGKHQVRALYTPAAPSLSAGAGGEER